MTGDNQISMDCDAFSIILSWDELDEQKKTSIIDFLFLFGQNFSRCGFPSMVTGSKSKGSIFGCRGNECQHLPKILQGNEIIVIDTPVKIGIHASCRDQLINTLKSNNLYFTAAHDNSGLCFHPGASAMKPNYRALIEALITSCEIPMSTRSELIPNKYFLHIADMGFRLRADNNYDMLTMSNHWNSMRKNGVSVEVAQLDLAFMHGVPQNRLVQLSCKRRVSHSNPSLLQKSAIKIFPIHELPLSNSAELNREKFKGTIQLKKYNWEKNDNLSITETYPDKFLSEHCSNDGNQRTRDSLSVDASTMHSLKVYETISHSQLQRRKNLPLTNKLMYSIGERSVGFLQTLMHNVQKVLDESYGIVRSHGISVRLEVSLRPPHLEPLRRNGHAVDFLLLACLAVSDFCSSKYSPQSTLLDSRTYHTRAMKLISELSSMIKLRHQSIFNQVYSHPKSSNWLMYHMSSLFITVGICPLFDVKYIQSWLQDKNRFDPHHHLESNGITERTLESNEIERRILRSLLNILTRLQFSRDGLNLLKKFVEESPEADGKNLYLSLSLRDKHLLANTLHSEIIPHISQHAMAGHHSATRNTDSEEIDSSLENPSFQHKKARGVEDEEEEAEQKEEQEDEEDTNWWEKLELLSDRILEEMSEKAPIPKHPLGKTIVCLGKLSSFWDTAVPGFDSMLSYYILECHSSPTLQHESIKNPSVYSLLLRSSQGTKLTRDNLKHICSKLLETSTGNRNESRTKYQSMLCSKYKFPIPQTKETRFDSRKDSDIHNMLVNAALCKDIAITLYENTDNTIVLRLADKTKLILLKESCIFERNVAYSYSVKIKTKDPYEVLSMIANSSTVNTMRLFLHSRMSAIRKLHNYFLSSDGTTVSRFRNMDTLSDLEMHNKFCLCSKLKTIKELKMSHNFIPEIVFFIFSFIYKTNVTFCNLCENKVYYFTQSNSRGIQYVTTDCTSVPPDCTTIIFVDNSNHYELRELKRNPLTSFSPNESTDHVFSTSPIGGRLCLKPISLKTLPNKKSCKGEKCFYKAISKLLEYLDPKYLEIVDHSNFDALDMKTYLQELSIGSGMLRLCDFISTNITEKCKELEMSIYSLRKIFETETNMFTRHHLIVPLMCLKFVNLSFGVFENKDKKKRSYFYAFNHLSRKVECRIEDGYRILVDRRQILYLYSSPKKTDYFVPMNIQENGKKLKWLHYFSMPGTLSHLGSQTYLECMTTMKIVCQMNNFHTTEEMTDIDFRPERNSCTIISTRVSSNSHRITQMHHHGFKHHAIIVLFPCSGSDPKWDACIVKNPSQEDSNGLRVLTEVMSSAPRSGSYTLHCIDGVSFLSTESGFYNLFFAYIASKVHNLSGYQEFLREVTKQSNFDTKVRNWLFHLHNESEEPNFAWICQLIEKHSATAVSQSGANNLDALINQRRTNRNAPNINKERCIGKESNQQLIFDSRDKSPIVCSTKSVKDRGKRKLSTLPKPIKHKSPKRRKPLTYPHKENIPKRRDDIVFPVCGLYNSNNLCYMNVVIQLLFGMQFTRQFIIGVGSNIKANLPSSNDSTMLASLHDLFLRMLNREEGLSLLRFKSAITELNSFQIFANNNQHDCEEFLMKVLTRIYEESLCLGERTVMEPFQSVLWSSTKCTVCGYRNIIFEGKSMIIEISIDGNDLSQCMTNYFKSEDITKGWNCSKCNKERACRKQLGLQERDIMIICLKRYNNQCKKVNQFINFPMTGFQIPNAFEQNDLGSTKTCYRLFAVINHIGDIKQGHYTLYMKRDGSWYSFNDTKVSKIHHGQVVSKNAYIVCYCKQEKFDTLL